MNERDNNAIIMTIGLPGDQGGDVVEALRLDLEALEPTFLGLICSRQSLPNAQRLIEMSGLSTDHSEIVELESAHDLDEVFRETNGLIQRLTARGYTPEAIALNYTSGTKVMGSGAVLSAVYNKIMELRYITGLGMASSGHRILTTKPESVFAYQYMLNGRRMLHDLRFRSAQEALAQVDAEFLNPEDRQQHRDLHRLSDAYEQWDNFYPDRFFLQYNQVRFGHEALNDFKMSEDGLKKLGNVITEMQQGEPGPHIITDLYNNAVRRLMIGRTEDAMARLYRAMEMLAQWVLKRDYGLDTNNLDTRRIPPRDRVTFEALRSMEDGMVKIGLRKAYDLLVILGAEVGQAFHKDPVALRFLETRSSSVLAHGLRPTEPESGMDSLERISELFKVEIPDFDQLAHQLQFPWIQGVNESPRPLAED